MSAPSTLMLSQNDAIDLPSFFRSVCKTAAHCLTLYDAPPVADLQKPGHVRFPGPWCSIHRRGRDLRKRGEGFCCTLTRIAIVHPHRAPSRRTCCHTTPPVYRPRGYFSVARQTPSQSEGGGLTRRNATRCSNSRDGPSSSVSLRHPWNFRSARSQSRSR